jgi:hypothetical protein
MQDQAMIERSNPPVQQEDSKDLPIETAEQTAPGDERTRQDFKDDRSAAESNTPMFGSQETGDFRSRWYKIQTEFIDDPRRCVQQADQLVAETVNRLTEIFAQEREKLEREWDRGENVSTEDLRLALQRYRWFFDRLLSV